MEDGGVWYCDTDNTEMKISVRVITPRPLPLVLQDLVPVALNETFQIDCQSTGGYPQPHLSWLDTKQMKVLNSTTISDDGNGKVTATLQLNATAGVNTTKYSCIAKYRQLPNLVQVSTHGARVVMVVTTVAPPVAQKATSAESATEEGVLGSHHSKEYPRKEDHRKENHRKEEMMATLYIVLGLLAVGASIAIAFSCKGNCDKMAAESRTPQYQMF